MARRQFTAGSGNRVAVRIDLGMPQQSVEFFHDLVGDGVLKLLSLLVDLGPIQAEHLHEEQFDQSVASQYVQGEVLSRRREENSATRLIVDQIGL